MRRPRGPPTNAAAFTEINNPALGAPAPVHIESLDRFGSVSEARKQYQIKLGHPKLVNFPAEKLSLTNWHFWSVEMWKEADEAVNQLFNLMAQVREKLDRKSPSSQKHRTSLSFRQFTWEQVIGEVQSLATQWSTSQKRSSKMMKCLEKLGKNSDAFKSWLELLPAGDYGSRYACANWTHFGMN